jgi:hypothetical protein
MVKRPSNLATVDFAECLVSIDARGRKVVLRNAPKAGDVGPVLRIVDLAAARQLVALLAMLAPALAIALPRDSGIAAELPADTTGSEDEVDGSEDVLNAVGVMFQPAGVHEEAGLGLAPPLGRLPDGALGDPRDFRRAARRPFLDVRRDFLEAGRVPLDKRVVDPIVLDH